jgi:hypothetical protein
MNEIECCGRKQSTPHCGWCGKEMVPSLLGLISYCRHRQKEAEKRAEALRRKTRIDYSEKHRDVAYRAVQGVARNERLVRKWKSWADELEGLLKSREECKSMEYIDIDTDRELSERENR